MKKIIGIVPSTLGFNTDNPFDDKYYVQNTYIKKIKEHNIIPIILSPNNLKIDDETLELCDAFLIIGGSFIQEYHYQVIEYAIKTNKKILGICLGMQAIATYSNNKNENNTLKKIDNHYFDKITHSNNELLVHEINIDKNSTLYKIFGNKIKVNSIHKYSVKKVSLPFKIAATYKNIIEAIEYKNIIGVQFHPELMKNTEKLFYWLTK